MRVALESPLGVAVLGLVAGEVPDDQAVVTATGEEHVGAGKDQSATKSNGIIQQPASTRIAPDESSKHPEQGRAGGKSNGSRFIEHTSPSRWPAR